MPRGPTQPSLETGNLAKLNKALQFEKSWHQPKQRAWGLSILDNKPQDHSIQDSSTTDDHKKSYIEQGL